MDKIKIQEVLIVEGKYDLNTVKQVVDGIVITTDGFGVFHNREKLQLIERMAETRGVIILTDSDGAGFLIRNYLKGRLSKENVKHAYIPDVYGKEKRKRTASKEGKLGVEGMRPEVLCKALERAGVNVSDSHEQDRELISKADLYMLKLSGTPNSSENRRRLIAALDLPEKLSSNVLLDVLNALFSRDEFLDKWQELQKKISFT